jgi:ATP-dependent DNA helicase RecQ
MHKIVYTTPETLTNLQTVFDQLYLQKKLDFFVIDEAHCIEQWGFTFREAFLQLSCLKKSF